VVRENQTGRMGTFETDVQVPDLRKTPLRMSSVVLSSQRVPVTAKNSGPRPLVLDQTELVPNITHVFTQDQHLYLQYEVYDAARGKNPAPSPNANAAASPNANAASAPSANAAANGAANATAKESGAGKTAEVKAPRDSVRVLTSIEFLQGGAKIYESKPVVANVVTAPERKAVVFQIDLPLQSLKPGFYICQVNVVDDVAGNFAFPRWPILIKETAPQSATQTPAGK
jgi:hypothetical protein